MFNNGGNEDLAVPGPVIQPEVDSISSKWVLVHGQVVQNMVELTLA